MGLLLQVTTWMTFKRPISYNGIMGKTENNILQHKTHLNSQKMKYILRFSCALLLSIVIIENHHNNPMIRILVMTSLIQVTLKREECKHENPLFFYIAQSFGEDKRDHLSTTLELSQTIRESDFFFVPYKVLLHYNYDKGFEIVKQQGSKRQATSKGLFEMECNVIYGIFGNLVYARIMQYRVSATRPLESI